jgi:hypothetical protein
MRCVGYETPLERNRLGNAREHAVIGNKKWHDLGRKLRVAGNPYF